MEKLAIIVPYRDRKQHLKKFIPHMNEFLKNKIDYKIFIIEQNNNKSFNRGKLKNIGFQIAENQSDYVCFHDVDQIPISEECDYSFTSSVVKLAIYVSQFNFSKRPIQELGGVILFNNHLFRKINGYSNDYWGWGIEDDDLGQRCIKSGVSILSRNGRYMSLLHETEGDTIGGGKQSPETKKNRELFNSIKNDDSKLFLSGLSDLHYEINSIQDLKTYYHIKVDF